MQTIEKMMPLAFFKKEHFSGSLKGMRYRVAKGQNDADEAVLIVWIWPEPYCFEKTEEEKKQYKHFLYSEEGLEAVREWLNEQYAAQQALWKL